MSRRIVAFVMLIGGILLALAGCDLLGGIFGPVAEDYFPLAEGAEWDYAATVELYDDPDIVDFDTTAAFDITLYVAGTKTIGDVETYELKLKDFGTDDTSMNVADVEAAISGFSIYVAATDDGIEVFGLEFSESSSVAPGDSGLASSFDLSGTFTEGLPILPAFIFVGSTAEFDFSFVDTETEYDLGDIVYTDVHSVTIDSEVVVITDGDKREILGKDYRGALVATDVLVDVVDTRTYPSDPPSDTDYSGTVTSTGEVFFAKKLGLASLTLEMDFGDAEDNEGQPKTIAMELVGTTLDD